MVFLVIVWKRTNMVAAYGFTVDPRHRDIEDQKDSRGKQKNGAGGLTLVGAQISRRPGEYRTT
ncbi:hypothetical protein PHYBLDRAFT_149145 [Phycomyces blakesleeanus NRRL 1555(-)]|uniref:Uncharacterized protein n=1 Tax=Phycomyces blakesleeanus (strain ATCC 8743b / DSM 1359 / FGSC 10004 / NBRC 33097 / NRRL 1555) TaxID=763407 RepID=A0A167LAD5_PHYB8|nr:hypothetical protein PHYBLDRAFT_149145 [Phycomyces blakesleeanus NRRL 1555(-)]OAD69978.1 hypothetical protein PHYBLDRAFT_149145 [Phycomyces blakesleeanus NRRL 1555(-)]|eukprot:XP_018288018.1 hypothetical protein PHYBLDRAFT_149145 [Phycomyces blakesleeanus NRRL 1555(-)]